MIYKKYLQIKFKVILSSFVFFLNLFANAEIPILNLKEVQIEVPVIHANCDHLALNMNESLGSSLESCLEQMEITPADLQQNILKFSDKTEELGAISIALGLKKITIKKSGKNDQKLELKMEGTSLAAQLDQINVKGPAFELTCPIPEQLMHEKLITILAQCTTSPVLKMGAAKFTTNKISGEFLLSGLQFQQESFQAKINWLTLDSGAEINLFKTININCLKLDKLKGWKKGNVIETCLNSAKIGIEELFPPKGSEGIPLVTPEFIPKIEASKNAQYKKNSELNLVPYKTAYGVVKLQNVKNIRIETSNKNFELSAKYFVFGDHGDKASLMFEPSVGQFRGASVGIRASGTLEFFDKGAKRSDDVVANSDQILLTIHEASTIFGIPITGILYRILKSLLQDQYIEFLPGNEKIPYDRVLISL